jgi:hypothetical protein
MPTTSTGMGDQWLRKWQLILGSSASSPPVAGSNPITQGGSGTVLSDSTPGFEIRLRFVVRQANVDTPNTAEITVYNLADSTAQGVVDEFDYCILQAGYQTGRYGTIFAGNVKQYERGHESAVDSYLKIFAADGDKAIQQATVNMVVPAGETPTQRWTRLQGAVQKYGVTPGYTDPAALQGSPLMRQGVWFGMAADKMRDFAAQNGATWSINDGQLVLLGQAAYAPGDIVAVNARSGMIGFPRQTNDGILVTCLINPGIRVMQRLQLNNNEINRLNIPGGKQPQGSTQFPGWNDQLFPAPISGDGTYAPLVIDYEGDSRGNPWYQHMTCMAVDSSLDRSRAVPAGTSESLPGPPNESRGPGMG